MAPALRQVVSRVRCSAARIRCLSLAKSSVRGSAPDRVQVRAVGRQKQQVCAGLADGTASALSLVAAEVVEDDDVARSQRRHQHLLDIGGEQVAVDRSVDHAGGIDAVVPQDGDEGSASSSSHAARAHTAVAREGPTRAAAPCWS